MELYKESSEDWSKKSHELEGVIKALEVNISSTFLGEVEFALVSCVEILSGTTSKCDLWDMAGQTHLSQVEADYKEKLEKEQKAREEAVKVRKPVISYLMAFVLPYRRCRHHDAYVV